MDRNIDDQVDALLQAADIVYKTNYIGCNKKGDDNYSMDQWVVTFTKGDRSEAFDFRTGLGLRAPADAKTKKEAGYSFHGLTQNDITRRTLYGRSYLAKVEELRKPLAPRAASVLHSIMSDGMACEMTHQEWCDDFGQDVDSRKGLELYLQCQQGMQRLRGLIGQGLKTSLNLALEDY